MKCKFKGAGVAIITPFKNDFSIDFDSLEKIIEHLIQGNVDFIVVLGSTGETATINKKDQLDIVDFTSQTINHRVPLVVGCTSNCTADAVENVKMFSSKDIDGILSAAPYYNKPRQEGIYQHFKAIAEATELPIILYNVPGRTASNILPQTCLKLANDFENIVAIKEASGNFDQVMNILNNKPEDFVVLSGEDALNVPLMSVGVEGSISVVGNCMPSEYSKMIHSATNGDFSTAKKIHYSLLEFTGLIFDEGNPSGIKAALNAIGLCQNTLRAPLHPVSD